MDEDNYYLSEIICRKMKKHERFIIDLLDCQMTKKWANWLARTRASIFNFFIIIRVVSYRSYNINVYIHQPRIETQNKAVYTTK